MEEIIAKLKTIIPKENFKKQPETALKTIRDFEHKYGIKTDFLLNNKMPNIPEEDIEKWISAYETMKNFTS